jgi:hypothetical protein
VTFWNFEILSASMNLEIQLSAGKDGRTFFISL